jgi:hypothetical protein
MPEAILSQAEWDAIKAASIRGVPDNELAEQFGIEKNAIHQRRFRDEVWKSIVQAKAQAVSEYKNPPEITAIAQKAASSVSENIARLGEDNRLLALQIAGKGLKQANAAPPDVQSWQDVKALMDIVTKASGMDQAQAVQVNVLSSQPMEFCPHFDPAIETDKVVEV